MKTLYNPVVQYYIEMLNDRYRNNFFKSALEKCAKDKIVLDLGSGTGILSFYALNAGAKHVYCVEKNPESAECTKKVLSDNFNHSRFTVLNIDFEVEDLSNFISSKIDILVSELIGPQLLNGGPICEAWLKTKNLKSDEFITIPDKLRMDIFQWNSELKFLKNIPYFDLESENTLDDKFYNSLLKFDSLFNSDSKIKNYSHIIQFKDVKKLLPQPDKVYKNCFTLTQNDILNKKELKFNLEDEVTDIKTLLMISTISFKNEKLILQNCSTWDNSSAFFVAKKSGPLTFTFIDNKDINYAYWMCSK